LASCEHFYSVQQDKFVEIDDLLRRTIDREIERLSEQALRTICIAYKEIDSDTGIFYYIEHLS